MPLFGIQVPHRVLQLLLIVVLARLGLHLGRLAVYLSSSAPDPARNSPRLQSPIPPIPHSTMVPSPEVLEKERRRLEQVAHVWKWKGGERPPFAEPVPEGKESVWDYPRPPALRADSRRVIVKYNGEIVADTSNAVKICETSHPPTWYIPREDIKFEYIKKGTPRQSFCEWKGHATYWTVLDPKGQGAALQDVAWSYDNISPLFHAAQGSLAFYPTTLDITVDGEPVKPQPSGFYGGWVTPELVGPFKGVPGSQGW
eukprot:TRINITY_DN795_c0_g1_i1.p1 TRINITY_DN795_c0_g1~~TRINITY_DN795_c0_g1_i1.p1  ORF type:complete len:256 (-),score=12.22 TRINITY_DN795_c0_g1_i1:108-875(-)